MGPIVAGRMAAKIEGDFVIFLIGARINRLRDVRGWWPVVTAMPRMLKELAEQPKLGLLHSYSVLPGLRDVMIVQYWRSFEHLHAYARARESEHLPAWADYNKRIKNNATVGIWHETFLVREGEYEAIYGNMPARGLGVAGELVPAAGAQNSALGRLGREAGENTALEEAPVGAIS